MATILVVDDDHALRTTLIEILESEGHEVDAAVDGVVGVRVAATRVPDLALVDVQMPRLSGPEMTVEMYLRDCGLEEVPVVLMSAAPGLEAAAAAIGTPYHLAKPFSLESLLSVIDRALSERRPATPLCP